MTSVEIITAKEARELLNNNGIEFLKNIVKVLTRQLKDMLLWGIDQWNYVFLKTFQIQR